MSSASPVTLLSARFPAKRVFITGAASGLGEAMARAFAAEGWHLGLADLSSERLAATRAALEARAGSVSAYVGDVASDAFVAESVAAFASGRGGLDVMINNAGVAVAGGVDVTPVADWRWIVDINLLGVVWGCRAALPLLRAQDSSLLLNVASMAGFANAPQMAAYNVTKAGVISLSETLAAELQGSGVQVSCAMPGFFRTHLLDHMRAPPAENAMAHQLMEGSGHDPDEAARAILQAAAGGQLYVVWPREYRLVWRLKRYFPRWFIRRLQKLRDSQLARARPPQG